MIFLSIFVKLLLFVIILFHKSFRNLMENFCFLILFNLFHMKKIISNPVNIETIISIIKKKLFIFTNIIIKHYIINNITSSTAYNHQK
jgi:hypothetical protein